MRARLGTSSCLRLDFVHVLPRYPRRRRCRRGGLNVHDPEQHFGPFLERRALLLVVAVPVVNRRHSAGSRRFDVSLPQAERKHVRAARDCDVLIAVQCISHRAGPPTQIRVELPEALPVARVDGDKAVISSIENQSDCRWASRGASTADRTCRSTMSPRSRARSRGQSMSPSRAHPAQGRSRSARRVRRSTRGTHRGMLGRLSPPDTPAITRSLTTSGAPVAP